MKAINILASTVAVLLVASSATAGPSKPGTTELRKPDKKAALEEKTELAGPQDAKTRPRLEPIASTLPRGRYLRRFNAGRPTSSRAAR